MNEENSKQKKRIAILISGRGSNMLALAGAVQENKIDAEICLILCNQAQAEGLAKAKKMRLATKLVEKKDFTDRQEYDLELLRLLQEGKPDLIVLAGFMHILGKEIISAFYGKIINIHPSLLPKYPGLNTHQKVIENKDKEHGLSIHYVSNDLDAGPIILQEKIEVLPEDDEKSLAARLLKKEHQALTRVVGRIISGEVCLDTATHQVLYRPA